MTIPSKPIKRSKNKPINEALIHYVWKTRSFSFINLLSTDDVPVEIWDWGTPNLHAGPDFSNVRIKYNGLVWAGHAEMHVKSSDWKAHKHSGDPNYDNVILHVVYEDDLPLLDQFGKKIITIELKDRIPAQIINKATHLITNEDALSCKPHIRAVSSFWVNDWKEKQVVMRLEEKVEKINKRLKEVRGDWEQIAFELLCRSLGQGTNRTQMEELARICPWRQIRKEIHVRKKLEALLFGYSGLLPIDARDEYIVNLKNEFKFLANKYQFEKISAVKWNFMRSRPSNFPTIRISQLCGILHRKYSLLRSIMEVDTLDSMRSIFMKEASEYWRTHYLPHKLTAEHSTKIGEHAIQIILINTCIPLLFAYGAYTNRKEYQIRALNFLYRLPAENNQVIRRWKEAGIHAGSAADSQALLFTYRNFCSQKKCLECRLGHRVICNEKDHDV